MIQPCEGTSNPRNRRLAAILALLSMALPSYAADAKNADHWVATWLASPCARIAGRVPAFNNQTVRAIVHSSIGGNRARVRFSNAYGTQPLEIGAASIGLESVGAGIAAGTLRSLTFGGRTTASIPPGALLLSDSVDLKIPALSNIAVSIYLPRETEVSAIHYSAAQTSFAAAGNATAELKFASEATTIRSWPFVMGLEVMAPSSAGSVVAFGDSITDGGNSTIDANHRWPNTLAERLEARKKRPRLAAVDAGIGGNRILHDGSGGNGGAFGISALARFDRDVLAQSGVKYVIVLEGINDIGQPGMTAISAAEAVTAEDIIAGLRQLIDRAHAKGLKIFGGTLTPFEGTTIPGYFSPEKETKRVAVNAWIRTGNAFDGVIDFEKAIADPAHPARMLAAYDSGDHLHPNDAGYKAMGQAVSLALFR